MGDYQDLHRSRELLREWNNKVIEGSHTRKSGNSWELRSLFGVPNGGQDTFWPSNSRDPRGKMVKVRFIEWELKRLHRSLWAGERKEREEMRSIEHLEYTWGPRTMSFLVEHAGKDAELRLHIDPNEMIFEINRIIVFEAPEEDPNPWIRMREQDIPEFDGERWD
ncbi:hypothetical protein QAD02_022440 [Eretmocerus hayati]|uniref:Uncharacterized protein n=1 Tax=Eretmocerus hayati TaxID=131215 RepID=A0ACC2PT13_9HYME|nr:hypothetical protein QAD02_022440 [Eretmocerus hayati]